MDADLQRPVGLSAMVRAALHRDLPVCTGQLVLLDAPRDASAKAISPDAFGPSRQPPAHRLDGNELSSIGVSKWRGFATDDGFCGADPPWRPRGRVDSRDDNGRNQSYGLGSLPALACSFAIGEVGDNSQPSRAAS